MSTLTKRPWTPIDEVELSPEQWGREFADSKRTLADVEIDPDVRVVDEHDNAIHTRTERSAQA